MKLFKEILKYRTLKKIVCTALIFNILSPLVLEILFFGASFPLSAAKTSKVYAQDNSKILDIDKLKETAQRNSEEAKEKRKKFCEKNESRDTPQCSRSATGAEDAGKPLEIEKKIGEVMSVIVKFAFIPTMMLVNMMSGLLDNTFIMGGGGQYSMEEILRQMWIVIRNLVNIGFVIILLVIAFMNVVKSGGENAGNWALKTIMPKFLLAMVLVNFSFLGSRVLLDVSNVATHAVFAIPQMVPALESVNVFQSCNIKKEKNKKTTIRGVCRFNIDAFMKILENKKEESGGRLTTQHWSEAMDEVYKHPEKFYTETKNSIFTNRTASYLIAYNLSRIQDTPLLHGTEGDMSDVIINELVSLIIAVANLIAFFALFIMLIARVGAMWLMIVLSPFIVVQWVMGDIINFDFGGMDLKKKFLSFLFMPAKVGVPLSIGYVMVNVGQKITMAPLTDEESAVYKLSSIVGGESPHMLLWQVITIAIIWFGVFAAMKDDMIFNTFVQPIKGMAEKVVGYAAKSVYYAPIFQIKTDGGKKTAMSFAAINRIIPQMRGARQGRAAEKAREVAGLTGENSKIRVQLEQARTKETINTSVNSVYNYAENVSDENWNLMIKRLKENAGLLGTTEQTIERELTGKTGADRKQALVKLDRQVTGIHLEQSKGQIDVAMIIKKQSESNNNINGLNAAMTNPDKIAEKIAEHIKGGKTVESEAGMTNELKTKITKILNNEKIKDNNKASIQDWIDKMEGEQDNDVKSALVGLKRKMANFNKSKKNKQQ